MEATSSYGQCVVAPKLAVVRIEVLNVSLYKAIFPQLLPPVWPAMAYPLVPDLAGPPQLLRAGF